MNAVIVCSLPETCLARRPTALNAPRRLWASVTTSAVVLLAAVTLAVGTRVYGEHRSLLWVPSVEPLPVLATFYDVTPIDVTVTRKWLKFTSVMPRYWFFGNAAIWRQMNFDDWDRLDHESRRQGLTRLFATYGHLVADSSRWRRMTAFDWDEVPQPVRAIAVVGMIEHWVRFYEVGTRYGLDPTLVLRTAKAIAMSESWFDHRAVFVNADNSADVGIGGTSQFARETVRRLHDRGLADFTLRDDEYFNPWLAARWLAYWLQLSLNEARGDFSLAIRAYNVGIGPAERGRGQTYLAGVERRRRRYFEGPSGSPTWSALSQYRRDRLWLPGIIVRVPLRADPPIRPCTEPVCGFATAPIRIPA